MGFDRAAGLESLLARIVDNITDTGVHLPGSTATAIRFSSRSSRVFTVQRSSNSRWQPGTACACSRVSAFAEQAAQSFDSIAQSGWRALGIHQCIFSEHVVFAVDCVPVEFAQTASVGGRESANRRQQ